MGMRHSHTEARRFNREPRNGWTPGDVQYQVYGRRLALTLAIAAALLAPSAATLWVWTPSGDDIQARVQALAASHGAPLLGEDEVPSQLVQAVVAIEDERFFEHHGIDSRSEEHTS